MLDMNFREKWRTQKAKQSILKLYTKGAIKISQREYIINSEDKKINIQLARGTLLRVGEQTCLKHLRYW